MKKDTPQKTEVEQQRLVDLLREIEWAMDTYGSLITSRQTPRRKLKRAIELGYVTSCGMVQPCDDDGCPLPNRSDREGFIVTEAGFDYLKVNERR